jgi:hypothetical protein
VDVSNDLPEELFSLGCEIDIGENPNDEKGYGSYGSDQFKSNASIPHALTFLDITGKNRPRRNGKMRSLVI